MTGRHPWPSLWLVTSWDQQPRAPKVGLKVKKVAKFNLKLIGPNLIASRLRLPSKLPGSTGLPLDSNGCQKLSNVA